MKCKLNRIARKIIESNEIWKKNKVFLKEVKYFKKVALLALILTLFAAFLEGLTVGLIASFLQALTNPSEPPIQSGVQWIDEVFLAVNAPTTTRLYRVAAFILVMIWLRCGLQYLGARYSKLCQVLLSDRIRKQIFNQLQIVNLSFYSKTNPGELINTITNQVNQLAQAFNSVSFLITKSSTSIAYFVSMIWLSWQLSIVAIALFTLLSVGISNLIKRVRESSFSIPIAEGQMTSSVMEFINGIKTVHAFGTQKFEQDKFYRAANSVVDANKGVISIGELVQPIVEASASTILIVIVIASFSLFIVDGQLQAASLLTFMFVLFRLRPLVSQTSRAKSNLGSLQGSFENIKELLRMDNKPYFKDGSINFNGFKESIKFDSVSFSYQQEETVLQSVDLVIPKGKTTALVGASGAGKTTLANLICRFYDSSCGNIFLDNINLKDFKINTLRKKMAIVSQDTFIFNTSVKNNIAYGLEDVEESAIENAAQLANAYSFITNLPQGFDTPLGDRGTRLSGGQRQRIAIARALLRDPDILILDEATSALDSVTESLIQESLEKLSKGRTVIVIAHRLSTIMKSDKVVVLEQGKIVEQGTYKKLLSHRGALWKYHNSQFSSNALVATDVLSE